MLHPVFARRLAPLALVAAAMALPATAYAQSKFEVVPYFGSFYAVSNYLNDDVGGTKVKQKLSAGPSVGGKVRYWFSQGLGFEANINFAWTGFQTSFPNSPGTTGQGVLSSQQLAATGRLVLRPRRSNLYFLAGAGYMHVSGDAWDSKNNPNFDIKKGNFTGVIGTGVRAQVAPKFAVDVGLDVYLYSVDRADPKAGSGLTDIYDNKFLEDVVVTVGIPIGGR